MNRFHFNNIGLRNKLLIIYIVSVFLPITLTHIAFYNVTSENVRTQKMHDLSLSVEQMANEFRKAMDEAVAVSSVLYVDSRLYTFLETEYDSVIEFIHAYNSYYRDISKFVPIYSSIRSINLYTDNETVIFAGGLSEIDNSLQEKKWYKDSQTISSFPLITRIEDDTNDLDELDRFSIIRELDYYKNNTAKKILEIELNSALIAGIFDNVTFPGDVYLLNKDNVIEYTTNRDLDLSSRSVQFDSIPIPENTVIFEEEYEIQYLNNWKVVGITDEKELLQEVQSSRNFIIYLAMINLVFPSLFIIYITSSLHLRILRILKHMRKVEDQNFELIEGKDYQDEIGELTKAFNRMASKIKNLINDVYVVGIEKKDLELQRKQAQLSALQSQINPHFLFNVLETIRMRSILKKEDETAKIIHNMAKMLRKSFIWGKDWVTVEEEIYLIKCFLEIQYYRFDDKMQYHIDVDPEAYQSVIPNMLLIPFVENASIHGVEPLKGQGLITITIRCKDEQLVCEIRDNGVGMEEETYEKLLQSLYEEEYIGENVGMKNVYYRLKLYYRDQFTFEVKSLKGTGTLIRLIIPLQK
ncbi:HAMP domain-containing protein [Aquibacillus halophilus]|uniref:HAMP domain-containing protein n=1 Tax=Aquibacillus halophilus TaxID=930132 RepID=A0A6A8DB97_9BACI|nr:sensor histidine kinase [Aquibacillus halophilus]MRH42794.1 HAMP domain-containing protein [Aquibacillus halophilus]